MKTPPINHGGFTLVEVMVSVALLGLLVVSLGSFLSWMLNANSQATSDHAVTEHARRAAEAIGYEVHASSSIYIPTTTASQLSLATINYMPPDSTIAFIDFFLCGTAICLKKENQAPEVLTSPDVQVTGLTFTQLTNGAAASIKTTITARAANNPNSSVTVTSTAALRQY